MIENELFYPPIHDIFDHFPELHRIMTDIVFIVDDIALDDFVSLIFE
jgi:hypothetical protein